MNVKDSPRRTRRLSREEVSAALGTSASGRSSTAAADSESDTQEVPKEEVFAALGSGKPEAGPNPEIEHVLAQLAVVDGFVGVCVVDINSGLIHGAKGGNSSIDVELAAAGITETVRAKRKTMLALALEDAIEDILITLGKQYYLIRPIEEKAGLFAYLVLDKNKSNLAMARHQLAEAGDSLGQCK